MVGGPLMVAEWNHDCRSAAPAAISGPNMANAEQAQVAGEAEPKEITNV